MEDLQRFHNLKRSRLHIERSSYGVVALTEPRSRLADNAWLPPPARAGFAPMTWPKCHQSATGWTTREVESSSATRDVCASGQSSSQPSRAFRRTGGGSSATGAPGRSATSLLGFSRPCQMVRSECFRTDKKHSRPPVMTQISGSRNRHFIRPHPHRSPGLNRNRLRSGPPPSDQPALPYIRPMTV